MKTLILYTEMKKRIYILYLVCSSQALINSIVEIWFAMEAKVYLMLLMSLFKGCDRREKKKGLCFLNFALLYCSTPPCCNSERQFLVWFPNRLKIIIFKFYLLCTLFWDIKTKFNQCIPFIILILILYVYIFSIEVLSILIQCIP